MKIKGLKTTSLPKFLFRENLGRQKLERCWVDNMALADKIFLY